MSKKEKQGDPKDAEEMQPMNVGRPDTNRVPRRTPAHIAKEGQRPTPPPLLADSTKREDGKDEVEEPQPKYLAIGSSSGVDAEVPEA